MNIMRHRSITMIVVALVALMSLGVPVSHAQTDNTLRIAKFSGEGDIETGHGTQELPVLPGIQFQINKLIGLTATTQVEVSDAVQRDPYLLTDDSRYEHGPAITATTGGDGIATFDGLEDGVYLVRELTNRSGETQYSVAAPFLVALPQNGERQVTIRAKNQELGASLTILNGQAQCLTRITFAMDAVLPAPDRDGNLYKFVMQDDLPKEYEFLRIVQVAVRNTQGDVLKELEPNEDYTLKVEGQLIEVALTETGLAKVAELRQGHPEVRLRITYEAKILADVNAAGTNTEASEIRYTLAAYGAGDTVLQAQRSGTRISNTAEVFVDGYPVEAGGGIETNPAVYDLANCRTNPDDPANPTGLPVPTDPNAKPSSTPGTDGSGKGGVNKLIEQAKGLASTGASVIAVLVIAAILVLLGVLLMRRKREEEDNVEGTD